MGGLMQVDAGGVAAVQLMVCVCVGACVCVCVCAGAGARCDHSLVRSHLLKHGVRYVRFEVRQAPYDMYSD